MVLGDFNAKLFHRLHGEEDLLGDFVFHSHFTIDLASSNRELLLEVCVAMSAVVGNTLFENSVENLVTYYAPGTNPKDAINPKGFSQIDFCLLDPVSINFVKNIWTNRHISFATRHLLMVVEVNIQYDVKAASKKVIHGEQQMFKGSLHMLTTHEDARNCIVLNFVMPRKMLLTKIWMNTHAC